MDYLHKTYQNTSWSGERGYNNRLILFIIAIVKFIQNIGSQSKPQFAEPIKPSDIQHYFQELWSK